jgi:hypothetical protein
MNDTLLHKLSAFPADLHIREVCRRGAGSAQCRYLVIVGGEPKCAKYSEVRDFIDRRAAENSMKAKGNNCEGLVGVLKSERGLLAGARVVYTESFPSLTVRGAVKDIEVSFSYILMRVEWDDGRAYDPSYSLDQLQIDITANDVSFSVRGAGTLAGAITF